MTEITKGMVLTGTGLSHRRGDSIRQVDLCHLARTVVEELEPRYGYCTATFWYGWDYAWGAALMEANVPYCIVLPYRAIGSKWHPSDRDTLNTTIAHADNVIYISDHYRNGVYADRDKYLASYAEGLVLLDRPWVTRHRVATLAREMGIPILDLWYRYSHLVLDNKEGAGPIDY